MRDVRCWMFFYCSVPAAPRCGHRALPNTVGSGKSRKPLLRAGLGLGLLMAAAVGTVAASPDEGVEFFEKRIRPMLVEHCFKCHSAHSEKVKGNLLLDSKHGMLKGGESGKPAVVPGDAEKSLLIEALRYRNEDLQMPPPKEGKLSDERIADFVDWVKMGAPYPKDGKSETQNPKSEMNAWWSFEPVRNHPVPAVKNRAWIKAPIDNFILAGLEAKGLAPAPPVDKRTLIRRATFDLAGLPPTAREVQAFLADDSADAFAKVVERLLASPRYGERWARHWLDVVRYTDSFDARGIGGEADVPEAYRYRDWVVNAFNHDLPYDQFVLQQIAGDILATNEAGQFDPDKVVATGVMAIGEWGTGDADKEKMLTDIVDDQIDVTGRAFLGLTLACARCHDHKFDPIPTEDYYSLAGIYFSSHILPRPGAKTAGSPVSRIPLVPQSELDRRKQREETITTLEKEIETTIDDQLAALARESVSRLAEYLVAAWESCDSLTAATDHHGKSYSGIAKERGLNGALLRRWVELLHSNLPGLLTQAVRNLLGNAGLHAWKNPDNADTPSVTVNATEKEISFITIKLPPRSLAVHPSPKAGVAVGWKSPFAGTIRIRGAVKDADPNCGDGIDWVLSQRAGHARRELAKGSIPNGGAQEFREGNGADKLAKLEISAGEMLELAVLPKTEHSCDTTVVELEVIELEGEKRAWNLTKDIVADVFEEGQGNPHGDGYGNKAVWHFYDLGHRQNFEAPSDSAFAKWTALFNQEGVGAGRSEIEQAAKAVQEELTSSDGKIANLKSQITSPKGPFWSPLRSDETFFSSETKGGLLRLKTELAALKSNPLPPIPVAHGLQEGGVPESGHAGIHDVAVHIRGRYDRLGNMVPRRLPRVFAGETQPPITEGSGRLQLARWMASPKNPLTARVMVNRVWQHHFGEGLVRTPNNFGKLGEPPTHRELLDYLAHQFIQSGWSLKAMHRLIMLSAVYQQSSAPNSETLRADADNKLLGRMNRRRLEAEPLRDSLLAVGGDLDYLMGGPAIRELDNHRRTLYLMTIRSDRSNYRMLFDAADPVGIVEKRVDSTVAPQALFLLNHPFALAQARRLAERLAREAPGDGRGKIEWLYQLLYSRPPSPEEINIGLRALSSTSSSGASSSEAWDQYCQALLCANEFVYVD